MNPRRWLAVPRTVVDEHIYSAQLLGNGCDGGVHARAAGDIALHVDGLARQTNIGHVLCLHLLRRFLSNLMRLLPALQLTAHVCDGNSAPPVASASPPPRTRSKRWRLAAAEWHALHAMPRELRGASAAKAARAAGDERNLAVQVKPVGHAAEVALRHSSSHAA